MLELASQISFLFERSIFSKNTFFISLFLLFVCINLSIKSQVHAEVLWKTVRCLTMQNNFLRKTPH